LEEESGMEWGMVLGMVLGMEFVGGSDGVVGDGDDGDDDESGDDGDGGESDDDGDDGGSGDGGESDDDVCVEVYQQVLHLQSCRPRWLGSLLVVPARRPQIASVH